MDIGALAALGATAFTLGLRHGLDPDHIAAIDGIARFNTAERPRLARFAGSLFSLGHGSVVIVIAVVTGAMTLHWAPPRWLDSLGSMVSICCLLGLGAINVTAALRGPAHLPVKPTGLKSRLINPLNSVRNPLSIMLVGALFAVSFDTVSQAAMFAAAAGRLGSASDIAIVAGAFVLGMTVTDGLNGLWIARLVAGADRRGVIASRIMTLAVGVMSIAIAAAVGSALVSPLAAEWLEQRNLLLGIAVAITMALTFGAALHLASRPARG